MRVVLEIQDSKAPALLEVLKGLKFVKVKSESNEKSLFLEELEEGVKELNLILAGKAEGRPAREILDEL